MILDYDDRIYDWAEEDASHRHTLMSAACAEGMCQDCDLIDCEHTACHDELGGA